MGRLTEPTVTVFNALARPGMTRPRPIPITMAAISTPAGTGPALYVRNTASDRWCRQWWAHPEAAQRLEALWEAYETARSSKDGGAFAAWWRTEADHHLPLLYSDQGPAGTSCQVVRGSPGVMSVTVTWTSSGSMMGGGWPRRS